MQDYKNNKILELIREIVKVPDQTDYEINGIDTSRAIYFYRKEKEKFKIIPLGSYTIVDEASNKYLRITDSSLLGEALEFQICYLFVKTSSSYVDEFPEIVLLQEHYNQLYDDFNNLLNQLKSNNILGDTLKMSYVLPQLDEGQVWVLRQGEMKAENIFDLDERLKEALEQFKILFSKWIDEVEKPRFEGFVDEKIQIANDELDSKTELEKIELEDYTEQKKNELDIYLTGRKPIQYATIAELQASTNLKIGDYVEVAGYYSAGDGANHKRIIADSDNGSGVQLTNELWANVVHNGVVNVSWFGAKKNIDNSNVFTKIINLKDICFVKIDLDTELNLIEINKKITITSNYNTIKNTEKFAFLIKYENCKIQECTFAPSGDDLINSTVIKIGEGVKNVEICDNVFSNISGERYSYITASDDVFIGDVWDKKLSRYEIPAKNVKIIKNNFKGGIRPLFLLSVEGILINNNYFEGCSYDAIRLRDMTSYTIITNNIFKKIGIGFSDNATRDAVDTYWSGHKLIITNNVVEETGFSGFDIKGRFDGSISEEVIISNNIISKTRYNGIQIINNDISDLNLISNFTISGNIITYTGLSDKEGSGSGTGGIYLRGALSGVTIVGNTISKTYGRGVYLLPDPLSGTERNIDSISINSNVIRNCRHSGISLDNVGIININSNIINNNLDFVEKQQYGILFTANGEYNINNNVIKGSTVNDIQFPNGNVLTNLKTFSNNSTSKTSGINFGNQPLILFAESFPQDVPSVGEIPDGTVIYNFTSPTPIAKVFKSGKWQEIFRVTPLSVLNTPYHVEKMKSEGVYTDFISYMDEKTAYDNQQREKEKAMRLAYEETLKENPDLTYEEFVSNKPTTFARRKRSLEIQEPVPSQALLEFKERYLG